MINTAVILAAGLGSRLKDKTKEKPKGFLEIEGYSLIERSIDKLIGCGIDNIIIGTGYLSREYEKLAKKNPFIKCVKSEKYETTGSMYTLYNLKDYIESDFILLESDLLYEINSIKSLINDKNKNVILASGKTNSHDEVFIEADKNNNLINMSKNQDELNNISAELVGISKVSLPVYKKMCDFANAKFKNNPKLDYEYCMVGVSKETPFNVKKINELAWIEIDDDNHLKRAVNEVLPRIKERESLIKVKRNVLLNPGPATTTDNVKYAQVAPDICPREKEFGDIMKFVSEELTSFAAPRDKYTTVLFGGSGTASVEAMISSVVDKDVLIIINNGAYGDRMCQMARIYGLDLIEFKSSNIEPIDFDELENVIKSSDKTISHLAIVHNETTSGLLNDLDNAGKLCKKYNIELIVDAMSSYAAIPINMEKSNISYLAASSNKNIQGMAGIGFVICKKENLLKTENIKPRNLYLNLFAQYNYFKNNYQMRYTPPVQILYALRQAIIETKLEGVENRYKRYTKSWETLIKGLDKLNLKFLVPKEHHSHIITSIVEPECENYDFNEMHEFFYNKGFIIYPGKLSKLNTFRISNIGAIDYTDIENFLKLLEEYLKKIKYL